MIKFGFQRFLKQKIFLLNRIEINLEIFPYKTLVRVGVKLFEGMHER